MTPEEAIECLAAAKNNLERAEIIVALIAAVEQRWGEGNTSMRKQDDYWVCPKCGGRNHFSSATCYRSAGCRADRWEMEARYHDRKAAELRQRAKTERESEGD